MQLKERIYAETDTQKLIEYASHSDWHLDKAHAMYELAIRAVQDPSLLKTVWQCIGREIEINDRQGLPLGVPAAVYLLDASKDETIVKVLVDVMQDWSREQQRDFFFKMVDRCETRVFLDKLVSRYGFSPKFKINTDGSIS